VQEKLQYATDDFGPFLKITFRLFSDFESVQSPASHFEQ